MFYVNYLILWLFIICFSIPISFCSNLINSLTPNSNSVKSQCYHKTECQKLENSTCFGTILPYKFSSFQLVNDSNNQQDVQDRLLEWQALKAVPKCWAIIQPFLCSLYMPKCDNGYLTLPTQEMCRKVRGPCRIVEQLDGWPEFLKCEQTSVFPSNCKNELRELKFNSNGTCLKPLVPTDITSNWYESIEGCGLQCKNPLYTDTEHEEIRTIIFYGSIICTIVSLFNVLTFLIDWKKMNSDNHNQVFFYIYLCFLLTSIGWLFQFLPGTTKENIVCHEDGTLKYGEASFGDRSWSCALVFILTYNFMISSLIWVTFLAFGWYSSYHKSQKSRKETKLSSAYHISALGVPSVLTFSVIFFAKIDGDSLTGICFVGLHNYNMLLLYVIGPQVLMFFISSYFIVRSVLTLRTIRQSSTDVKSKGILTHMIIKLSCFEFGLFIVCFTTFLMYLYFLLMNEEWKQSLMDYLVCQAKLMAHPDLYLPCQLKSRPHINVIKFQVCVLFFSISGTASWFWTGDTIDVWKDLVNRVLRRKKRHHHHQPPQNFKGNYKHINYTGTPVDPPGMDMISVTSQELSSTWTAAPTVQKSVQKVKPHIVPLGLRRTASLTEIKMANLSTRRHSFDSQTSIQISEREYSYTVAKNQKRKTRKERGKKFPGKIPFNFSRRRGSDTSAQSGKPEQIPLSLKNTIATSTGDLGTPMLQAALPANQLNSFGSVRMPRNNLIGAPPFTHGMADNSHRTLVRPNNIRPLMPNPNMAPNAMPYPFNYNYLQQAYDYYNYLNYLNYIRPFEAPNNMIPMSPTIESSQQSDTDYLNIVLSESDAYTDGHLTQDEYQRDYLSRNASRRSMQQVLNPQKHRSSRPPSTEALFSNTLNYSHNLGSNAALQQATLLQQPNLTVVSQHQILPPNVPTYTFPQHTQGMMNINQMLPNIPLQAMPPSSLGGPNMVPPQFYMAGPPMYPQQQAVRFNGLQQQPPPLSYQQIPTIIATDPAFTQPFPQTVPINLNPNVNLPLPNQENPQHYIVTTPDSNFSNSASNCINCTMCQPPQVASRPPTGELPITTPSPIYAPCTNPAPPQPLPSTPTAS